MPPLPTPFPVPTGVPTDTLDIGMFWEYQNVAPAISAGQSFFIWLNQYNLLTYAIILMIVLTVFRWLLIYVRQHGEGEDV